MLTEFGKFTRTLRIQVGEVLYEMAQKLGVSSAFLSAVEVGKKNIPKNWLEILSEKYNLNDEQKENLSSAIEMSSKLVKIDFTNKTTEDKQFILKLAKSVSSIDEATKQRILDILIKGE